MKRQKYFDAKDKCFLRNQIKEKTGYLMISNIYLSQAFRRRSFTAENEGKSNEIFEFIGDQVLSYYVVKIIADRCATLNLERDYAFRVRENGFTSLKRDLVSNENLARIIDEWGVAEYLIVGRSDYNNEVDKETKVKADLFEAIIGAIAVESNWNSQILEDVVRKSLGIDEYLDSVINDSVRYIDLNLDNAVRMLKELAEKEECSMPTYTFFEKKPFFDNEDATLKWDCTCSIVNDKTGITRSACAASKKDAKKAAAYLVLCEHFNMPNKYGCSDWHIEWIFKDGKLEPKKYH